MRWPQNAVSLVGRAGALSPGKTYKLMRALRKHALNYLGQLWMLASDRRHAKDVTAQMTELKADWRRAQKRLGKCRDKAGNLMPGWVVVQRRPTYVIVRQLDRWTQLSLLRVSDGSQRSIEGYFSRVPPPPKPARPARPAAPAPPMQAPPLTQTRPSPSPVPPDHTARPSLPQRDADAHGSAAVANAPPPAPSSDTDPPSPWPMPKLAARTRSPHTAT